MDPARNMPSMIVTHENVDGFGSTSGLTLGQVLDGLLDEIELGENLDCAPSGRSHLGNSNSESQSPRFSGSSNGTLPLSKSSATTIPESAYKLGSFEKRVVKCERNNPSGYKWEYQKPVLDGLLDEINEVDDIHAANNISGAFEDFLLDVQLGENLDCAPSERSHLGNSNSESQSPIFSGSSNDTLLLSKSSATTIPEFEYKLGSFEKRVVKRELNDPSSYKWEYEKLVLDGLLDEIDEVDDIHATNDISGAFEDFLLDVELGENLDCAPSERSHLGNSCSESQSPRFSGSSNNPLLLSKSSATTFPESEYKLGSFEKRVVKCELNDPSGYNWEYQKLIKVDEPCVPPALEDDAAEEYLHLLAEEPKPDHFSVDGVLCFGKDHFSWKQLELDDVAYQFDYGLERSCGGLIHSMTHGPDELELGVLDGLLDQIDEVEDIHAANDISGAFEDFLLDVELGENLDCAPSERSHLGNSNSESHSPGFSGSSNGTLPLSESSATTIPVSECKLGSFEKRVVKCELKDSPGYNWEYQKLVRNDTFTTTHELENLEELDDAKPLESSISYDENEKKAGKMSKFLRQTRLHKPEKTSIDEFSAPKAKHLLEAENNLTTSSNEKRLKIKYVDELHCVTALNYVPKEESLSEPITEEILDDDEKLSDRMSKLRQKNNSSSASKGILLKKFVDVKGSKSAPREESVTVTRTQAAFESRPRRGRPKKPPSVLIIESDHDHPAKRRGRSKKGSDRRKHQRMWTHF